MTDIKNCARCGGNHELEFTKLDGDPIETPEGDYTHWAMCPATSQPILMMLNAQISSEALDKIETCRKGHRYIANSREYQCPLCESDRNREKYRHYEDKYILPAFEWVDRLGYNLREAVRNNPGETSSQLLFTYLRTELEKSQREVKRLEEQRREEKKCTCGEDEREAEGDLTLPHKTSCPKAHDDGATTTAE